jgi:hypothetical protein
MTALVPTKYLIMRPEQSHETGEVAWPREPSLAEIRGVIVPLLDGGKMEHVSVLADPTFSRGTRGTWLPADMFVDEEFLLKSLPRNGAATAIYRRSWLLTHPECPPDSLPYIDGPAILFSRRVWF